MKTNAMRAASAASLILLIAGAVWLTAAQRNVIANNSPSWERVDSAAANATTGDTTAIGVLADEVLAHHNIDQSMGPVRSTIKNRLVLAEIEYHKGNSEGLTEDGIVRTVNGLAKRFNAPSYAFTDVEEVRKIRLKMLTLYPNLMGRGPASTRDDSKPHFDKQMSPIEAFHTTATLIAQKVFNPEFQITPEEKQAALQKSRKTSLVAGHLTPVTDNISVSSTTHNTGRTEEMLNLIHQGSTSTSLAGMLDQANQSLDLLGIKR